MAFGPSPSVRPIGWAFTGDAALAMGANNKPMLHFGTEDAGTGSAQSNPFFLPENTQSVQFQRAGGGDGCGPSEPLGTDCHSALGVLSTCVRA